MTINFQGVSKEPELEEVKSLLEEKGLNYFTFETDTNTQDNTTREGICIYRPPLVIEAYEQSLSIRPEVEKDKSLEFYESKLIDELQARYTSLEEYVTGSEKEDQEHKDRSLA